MIKSILIWTGRVIGILLLVFTVLAISLWMWAMFIGHLIHALPQ